MDCFVKQVNWNTYSHRASQPKHRRVTHFAKNTGLRFAPYALPFFFLSCKYLVIVLVSGSVTPVSECFGIGNQFRSERGGKKNYLSKRIGVNSDLFHGVDFIPAIRNVYKIFD